MYLLLRSEKIMISKKKIQISFLLWLMTKKSIKVRKKILRESANITVEKMRRQIDQKHVSVHNALWDSPNIIQ